MQLLIAEVIPTSGHEFAVMDFNAIEARVIAWLAGETWRNEVFASHGKIYEASASKMFNVPIDQITKDSPLRQKGKIAELALGYGGGVGALKAMGALKMGLKEFSLQPLVDSWRKANPNIVALWKNTEDLVTAAIKNKKAKFHRNNLTVMYYKNTLIIKLPSGRKLCYHNTKLIKGKYGYNAIHYEGTQPGGKWGLVESYGAKFVENIVQAISRDILAEHLLQARESIDVVMHVHDELVMDYKTDKVQAVPKPSTPKWRKTLNLKKAGFNCSTYRKG